MQPKNLKNWYQSVEDRLHKLASKDNRLEGEIAVLIVMVGIILARVLTLNG